MERRKILTYIYNISLLIGLVELCFLYVWIATPNSSASEDTLISSGDATSTTATSSDLSEQFSALQDSLARLHGSDEASSSLLVASAGDAVAENQTEVKNASYQVPAVTPVETPETSPKPSLQQTSVSESSDDPLYDAASKTAIWPNGPPPAPVNGMPVLYPQLKPICSCESSYSGTWHDTPRQYENGVVLRNYSGNDDVGMCQINLTQFGDTAQKLGYDLMTPAGNINFANWLFQREGSAPWYKSEHCWKHAFE